MAVTSIRITLRAGVFGPPLDAIDVAEPAPPPDDDVVGSVFFITYEDSKGDLSRREVLLLSVSWRTAGLCIGTHCLLRDAPRSFRVDRIRELAHGRTGELIDDPIAFFQRVAPPVPERTAPDVPARKVASEAPPTASATWAQRRVLRESVRPAAILLMFLARSDETLSAPEVACVARLIEDARISLGVPEDAADSYLLAEMTALEPSRNLVTRAVRAIVAGGAFSENLPARLSQMARADGVSSPEEVEAYRTIIATLRRVTGA